MNGELTVDTLYAQLKDSEPLSPELENEYLRLLHSDIIDPEERKRILDIIIISHQKLVLLMAIKFYWSSSYKDVYNQDEFILELYSAATLGFMYALGKYSPESGVKLTTYAANWCRYFMQKELYNIIGESRYQHKMREKTLKVLEANTEGEKPKNMKKWLNYFLNKKEFTSVPMSDKRYDLIIELRIALDSMGPDGKFLKDYYGINRTATITENYFCEQYGLCDAEAVEKKSEECLAILKNTLTNYDEISTVLDKDGYAPPPGNQLLFDF